MKTKSVNIVPVFEILGMIDEKGENAALVHRLILAYIAYNKAGNMLDRLSVQGKGYKSTHEDLNEKTIGFARCLFDKTLYLPSSSPTKKGFLAYFWKNHSDDFPYKALTKYNKTLFIMKREKQSLSKVLEAEIDSFSKLMKQAGEELSEEIDDYLSINTRFPIAYYFLAKRRLRKTVSTYLNSRIIIEKFIYDALLTELKLTKIPIDEIHVAFAAIIKKEQHFTMFAKYLWESIHEELTKK